MTHEETLQHISVGTENLAIITSIAMEVSEELGQVLVHWTLSWLSFMVDTGVIERDEVTSILTDIRDRAILNSPDTLTGDDILRMGGI